MTANQIEDKLQQLKRRTWTQSEIEVWYGINWEDLETKRVLTGMSWFAGTFEEPSTLGTGPYDRWHFEIFLQRQELVAVATAAAEWAMSIEDFRRVMVAFNRSSASATVGKAGPSSSIVRRSYLRDFHRGFPSLRRSIFSNHPAYINRIHHVIRTELHVEIAPPLKDLTDVALNVSSPRPGYKRDALTGEPVGLGHEVFLETGKPIQLAPDCCSWRTFAKYFEILDNEKIGSRPTLDAETLEILRRSE